MTSSASASAAPAVTKPSDNSSVNAGSVETNVRVVVRCRPLSKKEKSDPHQYMCLRVEPNNAVVVSLPNNAAQQNRQQAQKNEKKYTFETVFNPYTTQDEVFHKCGAAVVDEVLSGFKCTIFAYGQTGTGKTFTMEGDMSENGSESSGIIPRSVSRCFERLESRNVEYSVRVSFLEIYNEELRDMLVDSKQQLKLFESAKGVSVNNLTEVKVESKSEIYSILQKAVKTRRVAETQLNKASSRSHCIFTLSLSIKERSEDGGVCFKVGKLNLVDLAGSECVGRSGVQKLRAREAGNINQSLLTLGRVITALVEHHGHVPYRDSKLTRLLQDSLGGKTKTCIITTVSPSSLCVEETISTLDYALKAKSIKNKPEMNQRVSSGTLLREVNGDIEKMKSELSMAKEKNGIYMSLDDYEMKMAKLQGLMNDVHQMEQELTAKNDSFEALKIKSVDTSFQLQREDKVTQEVQEALVTCTKKFSETKELLAMNIRQLKLARFSNQEASQHVHNIGEQAVKCSDSLASNLTQMNGLHSRIGKEEKLFSENIKSCEQTETDHASLAKRRQEASAFLSQNFSQTLEAIRLTITEAQEESKQADILFKRAMEQNNERETKFADQRDAIMGNITNKTFESLDALRDGAKAAGDNWMAAKLSETMTSTRKEASDALQTVLNESTGAMKSIQNELGTQISQVQSCKENFANVSNAIGHDLTATKERCEKVLKDQATKLDDVKEKIYHGQVRCHRDLENKMHAVTKKLGEEYNTLLTQQRAGWEMKIQELRELDSEQGELFRQVSLISSFIQICRCFPCVRIVFCSLFTICIRKIVGGPVEGARPRPSTGMARHHAAGPEGIFFLR